MAYFLGWKDILRPIRDGYRHLFPTPDTGPTPEERSKRRQEDRLKGFTYFDTFEQLERWTVYDSDPLQRANTPLLRRCLDADEDIGKANVLLCHDYAGNYHEYESILQPEVSEEMYACEYLQSVELFVYFSHKLVCVPPPTWTNTLHRNGVKVLGTIILEPQATEIERLLHHMDAGASMKFTLAKVLADIAKHYGFDGYLVNIEKPFPKDFWIPYLQAFLVQLREELGIYRQLLWYDALTDYNRVSYQNALTPYNLPFAEACGSILTNYCWDESQAADSKLYAIRSGFKTEKVYFGIDVYAQGGGRITYPKDRGGGTNTGVAVAKLADMGMSAGLFAPAWSFEHFHNHGSEIEKVIWEGDILPAGVICPCKDITKCHQPIVGFSVFEHARAFPAGSDTFLFTDFTRAFSSNSEEGPQAIAGNATLRAQLGSQSVLPLPASMEDRDQYLRLTHRQIQSSGQFKLLIEAHNDTSRGHAADALPDIWLPLYRLNMPADGSLRFSVHCHSMAPTGAELNIYLKFSDNSEPRLLPVDKMHKKSFVKIVPASSSTSANADGDLRLHEIGVYLRGFIEGETVPILEIVSLSIIPFQDCKFARHCSISDIRIENRGQGNHAHRRVCWNYTKDYKEMQGSLQSSLPCSEITGPFSHFQITMDNVQIGRAHALEHILNERILDERAGQEVKIEVTGVGFDGRTLASTTSTLRV